MEPWTPRTTITKISWGSSRLLEKLDSGTRGLFSRTALGSDIDGGTRPVKPTEEPATSAKESGSHRPWVRSCFEDVFQPLSSLAPDHQPKLPGSEGQELDGFSRTLPLNPRQLWNKAEPTDTKEVTCFLIKQPKHWHFDSQCNKSLASFPDSMYGKSWVFWYNFT